MDVYTLRFLLGIVASIVWAAALVVDLNTGKSSAVWLFLRTTGVDRKKEPFGWWVIWLTQVGVVALIWLLLVGPGLYRLLFGY